MAADCKVGDITPADLDRKEMALAEKEMLGLTALRAAMAKKKP